MGMHALMHACCGLYRTVCDASQGQTRPDLLRVSWEKRGGSDAVCPWDCDLPGRAFDSWEPATMPSFSRFSSTSWKRWLGDLLSVSVSSRRRYISDWVLEASIPGIGGAHGFTCSVTFRPSKLHTSC